MRLFVRTGILFLIVYTAYWLYVELFPEYYNAATNTRWRFLKETVSEEKDYAKQPIIFLGDSRLNAGVNFSEIDSCFNLSAGGASTIELYFLLKKYLAKYPPPKQLFVSQSPRFFTEIFSFWGFAVRNDFFSENELDSIFYNAKTLNDTILGGFPKGRYWLYKLNYIEYYQPDIRASRIVFGKKRNEHMRQYMLKNKGKRPHPLHRKSSAGLNYETNFKRFFPSVLLDNYFHKLLNLAKDNRIQLIFVNMPMNKSSFEKLNPRFKGEFELFLSRAQAEYPNFKIETQLYAWPDSLFGDPSHLHSQGASVYTKYLKDIYLDKISRSALPD